MDALYDETLKDCDLILGAPELDDEEPEYECLFDMVECDYMAENEDMEDEDTFKAKYCLYCLLNRINENLERQIDIHLCETQDYTAEKTFQEYYAKAIEKWPMLESFTDVSEAVTTVELLMKVESVEKSDDGYIFKFEEKSITVPWSEMLEPKYFAVEYFKLFEKFLVEFNTHAGRSL